MSTFLRMTNWSDPDKPPLTVVVPQESLEIKDVYEAIEGARLAGFFVTYEVFEVGSLPEALGDVTRIPLPGTEKFAYERNMAIAYFYYARAIQWVTRGGVLASTLAAPLCREDLAWVLRCLASHPSYKGQTVTIPLQDGTTIEMKEGEVLPA